MKFVQLTIMLGLLLLGCGGCWQANPPPSAAPPPGKDTPHSLTKSFLNQKKELGARLEWNREVTLRRPGTFSFRVTSQGPFAVTILTDKGYRALKGGNPKALDKKDVLLTVDSKETTFEGKVTAPAGSSWFIIENQIDKAAEIRLECFE